MRYTAIALDYDGTIAHDGEVAPHVLDGLVRLKESGRKLVLVTGRELDELLAAFPGIRHFDRVVAENGALLYRPHDGSRKDLGGAPPDALVLALRASAIPLSVGASICATVRPHESVVLEVIAALGLEHQVIFNKGAVMVLPPSCNKASGLKVALAELGLSPRNVVACGDAENDHAMLDLAEYSVATANAVSSLKAAADWVTTDTHGDGVLEVVADLIETDLARLVPRRRRPGSADADDSPSAGAENTIFVSCDSTALAPAVLASVDGIAACGEAAPELLDAFAAAVSWGAPSIPDRRPREGQAFVWFRKSDRPVALIDVVTSKAERSNAKPGVRDNSDEVGRVLRQA